MTYCFFLVFIEHSYAFFLFDNDVGERRNLVILFNVLKKFLKMFKKKCFIELVTAEC